MLMAIAAGEKLKLEHFDVKNAFTQSDIDSEIYVLPPKGFETTQWFKTMGETHIKSPRGHFGKGTLEPSQQ